jgi:Skp family chaperone for outer membrane proteins
MKNYLMVPAALLSLAAAHAQQQASAQQPPAQKPPTATASTANTPSAALPVKIGLFDLRGALTGTAEGKKALLDLEEKFGARRTALQKKKIDLDTKQDQLTHAASTMTDEAKQQMARELDAEGKVFKREVEDLQADGEDAQNKIFGEIYTKMQPLIQQFAMQNGYAAIIDISNEQQASFVVWASNSTAITENIVSLYNQAHPSTGPAAPAKPATPAPLPPKKQ